jgi:hypothetical protein
MSDLGHVRGLGGGRRPVLLVVAALLAAMLAPMLPTGALASVAPRSSATTPAEISTSCGASNAEVEDAVSGNDVYAEWMGCFASTGSIAVATSTDGGRDFATPVLLPGSRRSGACQSSCPYSWDPAIVVARSGAVYASFMVRGGSGCASECPVLDVSKNHGQSFTEVAVLPVPASSDPQGSFGDRDFLAVAPNGTIYVTWDYGPSASQVRHHCSSGCAYAAGDFNAVIQESTNGGRTWSAVRPISLGFPYGGAYCAQILARANGVLDVLYPVFPTSTSTYDVSPGQEHFIRSLNGGRTWSKPLVVGAGAGTISTDEWWIDDNLSIDASGDLFATWDTQTATTDVGWLSYSRNGGVSWSTPIRVTPSSGGAEELVESTGTGKGVAEVAWQTPSSPQGYSTFVRPFSVRYGWLLAKPYRVSTAYGNPSTWPGDTFGIAALPKDSSTVRGLPIAITWGTAIGRGRSQIYTSVFTP